MKPHALIVAAVLFPVLVIASPGIASGQSYPNKPVRMMTPPPGGSNDFAARVIAPGLSAGLGQPVIIDNRPGLLNQEAVAKAAPDGYTLLLEGASFMLGHLLQSRSFDPLKNFSPVSAINVQPDLLVVHPSLPAKSVKELIALAKSRPGALNFGAGGTGSNGHLAMEMLKAMAGVNMVHISYKSTGPAINATLSGEVQVMIVNPTAVMSQIKSGRLRALAVTSPQPSVLFPGLPTVAASGLPGFETVLVTAVYAPAATPAAIINRLQQEIARTVHTPEVKDKFLAAGSEPVGGSPAELTAFIKAEIARYSKIIKDAGIRGE